MKIHVRFNGRSDNLDFMDIGISNGSTDQEVKTSAARYYDRENDAFDRMVIERHANGNITLRPEAIYG